MTGSTTRDSAPGRWSTVTCGAGSSFAEAEVATKGRRRGRRAEAEYDAFMVEYPNGEQRPIGSRRRDVARPDAFGSAPEPERRRGVGHRLMSLVLLLAALALVGGLVWTALSFTGVTGGSDVKPGQKVTITIPKGATSSDVAATSRRSGAWHPPLAW